MKNQAHIQLKSKQIGGGYINFSLMAPQYIKRAPLNVCFVFDVSLRCINEIENINNSNQYSLEEIFACTIQHLLQPLSQEDRVSFVLGCNSQLGQQQQSIMLPTQMTEQGKKTAISFIQNFNITSELNNTTDSLQRALGMLRDSSSSSSSSSSSDSQNRISSPVIILISDEKTKKKNQESSLTDSLISRVQQFVINNKCLEGLSIHTFGVSQDVDTFLLLDLAREFSGSFTFLQDFSAPEKVLSNVFANLLSCYTSNVILDVTLIQNGARFAAYNPVSQLYPNSVTQDSTHLTVKVGPVQYCQTREVVVRLSQELDVPTDLCESIAKVSITYDVIDDKYNGLVKNNQIHEIRYCDLQQQNQSVELLRLTFVDYLYSNIKKYQFGIKFFAVSGLVNLAAILEKNISLSPYINELFKIVKQHLATTFSSEKAFKSNKNILLTLLRSHLLQQQSIAHDSLSVFAHKLFTHYLLSIEQKHSNIPFPTPSPLKKHKKQEEETFIKIKQFDMYEIYESTRI